MRLLWLLVAVLLIAVVHATFYHAVRVLHKRKHPSGDETRHRCHLEMDPHLVDFQNESASVPVPCVYRVAKLEATSYIKSSRCSSYVFSVFAASDMSTYRGRFYVSYVKIIVKFHLRWRKPGFLSSIRQGTFETDADRIERFLNGENITVWKVNTTEHLEKAATYGYNITGNQAFLSFYGATPYFTFRPVNRSDGIPQRLRPGLVIETGAYVLPKESAEFPKTLCSTMNDNRSLADLADQLSLTVRQFMLYTVLQQQVSDQFEGRCTDALTVFANADNATRIQAIRNCEPFLRIPKANCLENTGTGAAFQAFLYCFKEQLGDTTASSALATLTAPCTGGAPSAA